MDMNSLQDRLQREARERLKNTSEVINPNLWYVDPNDLGNLISYTITETIKAGVSAIEGEKKETDNLVPLDNYEHPEYDQAVGFNQALQTAVTKLQELNKTNGL